MLNIFDYFITNRWGGYDLKTRILGRSADEDNRTVFDDGEKRILLSFIKAMNLIDEKYRPHTQSLHPAGVFDDSHDVGLTGRNGRYFNKMIVTRAGDDAS
jgi:hypothetical protein